MASRLPQQIQVTSSIFGNTIPQVYGPHRMQMLAAFRRYNTVGNIEYYAGIFSQGEQASITDPKFGDEPSPSYLVGSPVLHPGDGSALSTILTDSPNWVAGWMTPLWERMSHMVFGVNKADSNFISWPSITVMLGGATFTSFGLHTAKDVYTNIADVVYNIYHDPIWLGDSTYRLDLVPGGSWEQFQEWWADKMGDDTDRGIFSGPLYHRIGNKAIAEVLGHGFAEKTFDQSSSILLWGEVPPPKLTKTCTAVATNVLTFTADISGELQKGNFGFLQNYWDSYEIVEVLAIDGPGTGVTIDQTVTVAAGTIFRRLHHGGVYLKLSDIHTLPTIADVSASEIADVHRVKWTPDDDPGEYFEDAIYDVAEVVRVEKTLSGCKTASFARRHAMTGVRLENRNRFRWAGLVTRAAKAANLQVGDIFLFDDGRGVKNVARIHPPRVISYADGLYEFPLIVQFDGSVFSSLTQSEPSKPDTGEQYGTVEDHVPTLVNQRFDFDGKWGKFNLTAADDLTPWTQNDCSVAAVGGISTITPDPNEAWFILSGSENFDKFGGVTEAVIVVFLHRQGGTFDDGHTFQYVSSQGFPFPASIPDTLTNLFVYEDDADTDWKLVTLILENSGGARHYMSFGGISNAVAMEFDLRDVYWLPRGSNPGVTLTQHWSWTEDVDAADTVLRYEIRRENPAGGSELLGLVPVGSKYIDVTILSGGVLSVSPSQVGGQYFMRVVGRNGTADVWPDSQSFSDIPPTAELQNNLDVDVDGSVAGTGKASGSLAVIHTDDFKLGFDTPGNIGLAETDTAESFASISINGGSIAGQRLLAVKDGRINITELTAADFAVLEFGTDVSALAGGFFMNGSARSSYGGNSSLNLINVLAAGLSLGTSNSSRFFIDLAGDIRIEVGAKWGWSSTTNPRAAADTWFERLSAGVVKVGSDAGHGDLEVGGFETKRGVSGAVELFTGADTLDSNNHSCLCDASGGAFTLNFPAAASNPGREYIFKSKPSSVNDVTLNPDSGAGELIDEEATWRLVPGETIEVKEHDGDWWIMG